MANQIDLNIDVGDPGGLTTVQQSRLRTILGIASDKSTLQAADTALDGRLTTVEGSITTITGTTIPTQIAGVTALLDAHIADTSDVHLGSSIGITPYQLVIGTNVQTGLQNLSDAIAANTILINANTALINALGVSFSTASLTVSGGTLTASNTVVTTLSVTSITSGLSEIVLEKATRVNGTLQATGIVTFDDALNADSLAITGAISTDSLDAASITTVSAGVSGALTADTLVAGTSVSAPLLTAPTGLVSALNGTFTGTLSANTLSPQSGTTLNLTATKITKSTTAPSLPYERQIRASTISDSAPSGGANGDVWFEY